MKRLLIVVLMGAIVSLAATDAKGTIVEFDFEALALNDGPPELSQYMTDLYGSSVTVTDGIVHNTGLLGEDKYVHGCEAGPHEISICFDDIAITSVSFDWAAEWDEFNAYADGAEEPFFHQKYSWFGTSGNSGTIVFESPVNCLLFIDGDFLGQIEIDNLIVTPIPEPAMICLLGLGGLLLRRKRK